MRNARANKIDENQPAIVKAIRDLGATVQTLQSVGSGCPDILVGWRRRNYLMEIKNPESLSSRGTDLTKDQEEWHAEWRGQVIIVESADDAIDFLKERDFDDSGYSTH